MPTTEIFQCQLKAGSNIGDAQNEAAKVVKAIGDKLKVTPGVQQIQFGMQIEKPDFFQLFVSKFRFFLFFFFFNSLPSNNSCEPATYLHTLSYSQLSSVFFPFPSHCGAATHTYQTNNPDDNHQKPNRGSRQSFLLFIYFFFKSLFFLLNRNETNFQALQY